MSTAPSVCAQEPVLLPSDPAALFLTAWHALNDVSGAWVMLVRADGIVAHANDLLLKAARLAPEDILGRHVSRLIHPDCVDERTSYYAKVAHEGKPLCVEGLVGGAVVRCCLLPVPPSVPGELPSTLVVSRPVPPDSPPPALPLIRARCDDRGPLSSLTEREIDVLRLIGRGLTTAQIARELHRSIKTIEWHRVSLGSKLGASNRVELARIAIRFGLASPFDALARTTDDLPTDAPK